MNSKTIQRCQPKKIKIWEITNSSACTKKNCSNYSSVNSAPKMHQISKAHSIHRRHQKSAKIYQKNVFYALFFGGRFGDPLRGGRFDTAIREESWLGCKTR